MPVIDTLLSLVMTLSFAALAVASLKLVAIRIPAKRNRRSARGYHGHEAGR